MTIVVDSNNSGISPSSAVKCQKLGPSHQNLERLDIVDVDLDLETDNIQSSTADSSENPTLVRGWFNGVFAGQLVFDAETTDFMLPGNLKHRFAKLLPEESVNTELLSSLGPPEHANELSYTIAVCTADRPESLARCLESFRYLNSAVTEVIIIDNGCNPTDEVEKVVDTFGFRYVREPNLGLNRARNRALVEATTDLLILTDDDVEIRKGWDQWLIDGFADPLVMATAGLVLAASLDTPAMISCEIHAPHSRGPYRKVFEHSKFGGNVGVGASMAMRRNFLLSCGGFPEQLDAGTPTGTGGDTWAFGEVLRRGYRAVYEPRSVATHWHRDSDAALVKMFEANASGVWALVWHAFHIGSFRSALQMTKASVSWHWTTVRQWRCGDLPGRLLSAELEGAIRSPLKYCLAVRQCNKHKSLGKLIDVQTPAPWFPKESLPEPVNLTELPTTSVVIPTRGRGALVTELVSTIQTMPAVHEIIVVIDGDVDGTEAALSTITDTGVPLKIVVLTPESNDVDHGSGASVARNAGAKKAQGEVLIFLDDDVAVHASDLIARHAGLHRNSSSTIGVGPALIDQRDTLSPYEIPFRNWWVDHVSRLRQKTDLGWIDVCTGNLSITRAAFDSLGGFNESLPRREDWEFGLRALKANMEIKADYYAAVVQRNEEFGTLSLDAFRDGFADSAISTNHPHYSDIVSPPVQESARVFPLYHWAYNSPDLSYRVLSPVRQFIIFFSWLKPVSKLRRHWSAALYFAGRGSQDQHLSSTVSPFSPLNRDAAGDVELGKPFPYQYVGSGSIVNYTYNGVYVGTHSSARGSRSITNRTAAYEVIEKFRTPAALALKASQT